MGSSSSKFRKHLQNGDEYAAVQLYNNNSDLRKGLDPNLSYGDTYNHDTPLHLVARHGMKSLLRIFLNELGGNPNKKNNRDETALHGVCMTNAGHNFVVQQRRAECLSLILHWRGATLRDGEVEKVGLGTQDEKKNTALHYAAASGLKRCVELLVSQGAPLFLENEQKYTPCDSAEKSNQSQIALYLESKMVFSNEEENVDEDLLMDQMEIEEQTYSGLRAQDLQEAKDQLLVETSDMLRVPLFTAEALLRNHEWSREMLLEAWMEDPLACCDKCGVLPPSNLLENTPSTSTDTRLDHDLKTPTPIVTPPADIVCDICACLIDSSEELVPMTCDHQFCKACWKRYLTGKIEVGEAHNITCPGYECSRLVPVEIIETVVSRDMARRYLQFDIKAFVESNPSIKWCPYPGCGRAVKLPDAENPLSPTFRGINDINSDIDFSHAVDCGNGHIFCWECLGEAHEPASCDNWKKWHAKIAEIRPEELHDTDEETETSANCLWLVTNSKNCPNCKSPIQKNEGCNHMKCSKCKHDFCWVCQEPWKKHSSATGGYFRCNRYEVSKKVEETHSMQKEEAEVRNKRLQELNRFVHYYTRYKNHENSFKLEEPLLNTAKEKMMVLAKAVTDDATANQETKFVEEAVTQLLKSRRVLKCSYTYGYYLDDSGYKKPIFEFMQTELEECTETLSEMVARPYLRTPRSKIIQTAHLVSRKRHEFVTAISKGLVPPDTSPNSRKKKREYGVELDEDLKKALMASIQSLDPKNPWVKDPSGKHTNVTALLDWPEDEEEEDDDVSRGGSRDPQERHPVVTQETLSHSSGTEEEGETSSAGAEGIEPVGECIREGCTRPRALNPRTGEYHDHCSLKCLRIDKAQREDSQVSINTEEYFSDLELLRALEMSRLQFLREMGQLRPGSGDRSPHSPHSPQPSTRSAASSRAEFEASMSNLNLQDPPKSRTRIASAPNKIDGEPVAPDASRLSLNEHDDDLRLAIALSLKDSRQPARSAEHISRSSRDHKPPVHKSLSKPDELHDPQQDPEYTSIVQRVPNTSVEDLNTDEVFGHPKYKPTYGAYSSRNQAEMVTHSHKRRTKSHDYKSKAHFVEDNCRSGCDSKNKTRPSSKGANPFGLMKDLSMTNIVPSDVDKIKDFKEKDLSSAFTKMSLSDSIDVVFEPRTEYEKISEPHEAAELPSPTAQPFTFEDPWLRQDDEGNVYRAVSSSSTDQWSPSNISPPPRSPEVTSSHYRAAGTNLEAALENLHALSEGLTKSDSCTPGMVKSDSLDPGDIHIDSQMLESLLQGAEEYKGETPGEEGAENTLLLGEGNGDREEDKGEEGEAAVFV